MGTKVFKGMWSESNSFVRASRPRRDMRRVVFCSPNDYESTATHVLVSCKLAQLVEQITVNDSVAGSIPAIATIKCKVVAGAM